MMGVNKGVVMILRRNIDHEVALCALTFPKEANVSGNELRH